MQVDDLSIVYQGNPLFKGATFTLQTGERCGLVGRNGSGKTTLFRILSGKETPDSGSITMRKKYAIGMLDQHIVFTKPTLIEEAALGLREEEKECIYKAETILFGLGFREEDLERSPSEFSGGYQLRLHLAKVLISDPDCLFLDEPTNYLDIVSIRWFQRFLQDWKGEFVLISHDREFMDSVTTHTMGIHRQKIHKVQGSTITFYEQLFQQEEIYERTRQNQEKKRAHTQSFIDRFGAKASKATQAASRQKLLSRIPVLEKLRELNHLDFSFKEAPFPGKSMLDATEVAFSYNSETTLIEGLTLSVEKAERIAIIGKNGRGKSTILRLLAQELSPRSGTLKCSENTRIGYFGQTNIDRLHPRHTIEEEISIANSALNMTEVRSICGLMMFSSDRATKLTSVLSGGERSRVLLGKILAKPCNVLLLDEPTHHLDMESIEALIDALEDFEGAVIIVTHSELILKRLSLDKIIVCREGQQEMFLGNYEDFLDKDGWHDEADMAKPKKKVNTQQEDKQQRANQVNARAKALKPITQEIERTETSILNLELEQEQTNTKLVEISQKNAGAAIQELSRNIAQRQKKLDELYKRLEELSQQRAAIDT
ncbi:MAG: ABC-F family ATP-binding cassette domain-containing protein [Parachlamydiaceae bacterium]|nr:ABC-F family ATP-binding cassette domain-containing protein [Parachlamydiaceae bacterium]